MKNRAEGRRAGRRAGRTNTIILQRPMPSASHKFWGLDQSEQLNLPVWRETRWTSDVRGCCYAGLSYSAGTGYLILSVLWRRSCPAGVQTSSNRRTHFQRPTCDHCYPSRIGILLVSSCPARQDCAGDSTRQKFPAQMLLLARHSFQLLIHPTRPRQHVTQISSLSHASRISVDRMSRFRIHTDVYQWSTVPSDCIQP